MKNVLNKERGRHGDREKCGISISLSPHVLVSLSFLSATNQRHDFHTIAVIQDCLTVLRARNDFEIHFHRHVWLCDTQFAEQVGHGAASGNFADLSVDLYVHP